MEEKIFAFPRPASAVGETEYPAQTGMELRDYFALRLLEISLSRLTAKPYPSSFKNMCANAYICADMLIAARKPEEIPPENSEA